MAGRQTKDSGVCASLDGQRQAGKSFLCGMGRAGCRHCRALHCFAGSGIQAWKAWEDRTGLDRMGHAY